MQSLKVVLGLAAAWSVAMGCAPDAAEREACELGTEGCGCRDDGECDPGLVCVERRKGDGDRCDPIAGAIDRADGAAGGEGTGKHSSGPDAGAGSGGSSTGGHTVASGGAATDEDAGSSGASTGSGGASAGSGGVATGSGGASSGAGGSHQNASGGASSGSGGHPASGGAPGAGGAPVASGGAAGSGGARPGISDACLSCATETCADIEKQCKSDAICKGCLVGIGKGGDCTLFDSLFGGVLACVCQVQECIEQCGPSCPRR